MKTGSVLNLEVGQTPDAINQPQSSEKCGSDWEPIVRGGAENESQMRTEFATDDLGEVRHYDVTIQAIRPQTVVTRFRRH